MKLNLDRANQYVATLGYLPGEISFTCRLFLDYKLQGGDGSLYFGGRKWLDQEQKRGNLLYIGVPSELISLLRPCNARIFRPRAKEPQVGDRWSEYIGEVDRWLRVFFNYNENFEDLFFDET